MSSYGTPVEILLIDDSLSDVHLTRAALKRSKVPSNLGVAKDGIEGLAYLRKQGKHRDAARPDLILLDLNMPKMNGHEVLEEIKGDPGLRSIPVVILTTSKNDQDIHASYDLHANWFLSKPVDLEQVQKIVERIDDYWHTVVRSPNGTNGTREASE